MNTAARIETNPQAGTITATFFYDLPGKDPDARTPVLLSLEEQNALATWRAMPMRRMMGLVQVAMAIAEAKPGEVIAYCRTDGAIVFQHLRAHEAVAYEVPCFCRVSPARWARRKSIEAEPVCAICEGTGLMLARSKP